MSIKVEGFSHIGNYRSENQDAFQYDDHLVVIADGMGGHDARQCRVEGFAGKELTAPNVRRAAALNAMRDHNISQRRACRLVGVDPKTVRRDHEPDNPEVREEMQAIASKRRRFARELDALVRL